MFVQLDQIEVDMRRSLAEGVSNRASPMHTAVMATADADLRVMVLRAFDAKSWTVRLHTDARSSKVAVIGEGAPVGLLFYDAEARIQIRAKGAGRIETRGPAADAAWAAASNHARRCYLANAAPGSAMAAAGSGLPEDVEGQRPSDDQLIPARGNFAVLQVQLQELDWLCLDHEGHRRARFVIADGKCQGTFTVP
ncbi:flavin-binding protein [Alteraurantiacibacter aestuarii]|uniref:pyridoxamine 5'-phosphate oxidase family protein n=1 Tax=Alteraurantiacibacter aestuarii TaxID=650004 RepID=UPI0031DB9EFC